MIFHLRRRVYWRGRRIHHGLTGAVLAALGVVLMLDDAKDFPWRLRDTRGLSGPNTTGGFTCS